jgi:hypothetical protein
MCDVLAAHHRDAIEKYKTRLCDGIGHEPPGDNTIVPKTSSKGNRS